MSVPEFSVFEKNEHMNQSMSSRQVLTENDLVLAGVSTVSISSLGLFLNGIIFLKFISSNQLSNGFHVLCLSKSISNSITCLIGLLWVGPAILLNQLFLPFGLNKLLGQINEYGVYSMGPLTQALMAIDRFLIIFFPLRISDQRRCKISVISIIICWIMSSVFVGVTYGDNCWVSYNISLLNYISENTKCDDLNLEILAIVCLILVSFTFSIQILNFIRLMYLFSKSSSQELTSSAQRWRTLRLFIQSVIQDCLHGLDLLNSKNFFGITNLIGHFFIFTFSLIFVHALDGFIMCLFHCNFRKARNRSSKVVVLV